MFGICPVWQEEGSGDGDATMVEPGGRDGTP